MLLTKKKAKTMSLDGLLRVVDYDTADLLIRFYCSLNPVQRAGFMTIMRKQLRGGYEEDLAKNQAIDAQVEENEAP